MRPGSACRLNAIGRSISRQPIAADIAHAAHKAFKRLRLHDIAVHGVRIGGRKISRLIRGGKRDDRNSCEPSLRAKALKEGVSALMVEMPVEQHEGGQVFPVSEEVQGRFGILFSVQDDIKISAQQRLTEEFPFAWTIVDQ